ncbi:MAG: hypothetical protein AAGI12_07570 [Pseudomonadota bacterium]
MSHFRTIVKIVAVCLTVLSPVWGQLAMARDHTLPSTSSADEINAALATVQPGDRVVLGAGTFNLAGPLRITRDGVALVGAGSGKTVLRFQDETSDYITVKGRWFDREVKLAAAAAVDETRIVLSEGHTLKSGDMIYLQQPNTRAWIAQNGWTNVAWKEAEDRPFRESLHRVVSVKGRAITLATALPFALSAKTATARRVAPRKNVSISGLTVTSNLGTPASFAFTNERPAASKHAALRLRHVVGFKGTDLEFKHTPSSAIALQSTIESTLDGISVEGAHNKGGLGNGYGLELKEAFDNRLTNLTIRNMRHAVIFSAWHAEARNHVHVRQTNRDINFHGSVDHSNTVEIDEIALEFAPDRSRSKRRNVWPVLSPGGTNHARTDFLATNAVAIKNAKGSWRDDVLVGSAEGAKFEGGFGKDTFVVTGYTQIVDFKTGDRVRLIGEEAIYVLEREGVDTVLRIAGQTRVRFLNTRPAQIDRSAIEFTKPANT